MDNQIVCMIELTMDDEIVYMIEVNIVTAFR